MYLADCKKDAVITPQEMTYLFAGDSALVFTHRTHRGISTLAYSWPGQSHKLWKISNKSGIRSEASVPLCGSDMAGLVVIGRAGHVLDLK